MIRTACLLLIFLISGLNAQHTDFDNATDVNNATEINIATVKPEKTYKEAEKEVTDFVYQQIRALMPRIVDRVGTTNLSQKCMTAMMKTVGSLRRMKGWTFKLLDSIGKPTPGILKGTSFSLGQYEECLDLMVNNKGLETQNQSETFFQGKYCTLRLKFLDVIERTAKDYYKGKVNATELGKLQELIEATPYVPVTSVFMTHFVGICLPSTCTEQDLQQIFQIVNFPGSVAVERCEIKSENEDINKTQMTVMIIFLVLIGLVCVSTLIDWLFHNKSDMLSSLKDKKCVSVAVSFSFCNNNKILFKNIEDDTDHALTGHCVRGIVVASVAWITLGQTYLLPYDTFYMQSSSLENLKNYLAEHYFTYIVNYPLATDALFVCYGFILTYTLWYTAYKNQDVKANVLSLIIQNYVRIVIPVLLCLGIAILLPFIGSGPFWNDFMDNALSKCSCQPWAYVGMFSNYLNPDKLCFPHLWFPSCLAQLTLIGIVLSWVLSRNMKFGIMILVLLALAGNATVAICTYIKTFEPSYVAYFVENSSNLFWKLNYSLPLTHFGPYAIGMLTGILVARRSGQPLSWFLSAIGWIICLSIIEGLMLFIYKYHMEAMNLHWSALYAGFHRTIFAFCVAWVILACSFGNGGFVNSILSWRVFDPLFRLSYYSYIFNFIIIAFTVAVSREHFYYSHLDMVLKAISYICVSYIISYFLYMILELPLKSLCSAFCRNKSSQINVSMNNISMNKAENLAPNGAIEGSCKLWSVSNSKLSVPN